MFFLPETRHRAMPGSRGPMSIARQDGWLVKLELAGVRPDEIRLVTNGPHLLVEGTRRDEHCCQATGCHCMEIAYSSFQRAVELPGLSQAAEIMTSYVDGMLLVRIKTGGRS